MNKETFIKRYGLTEDQFLGKEEISGSLYLSSLTSIPETFNPTVGGYLDLSSLTSIPETFNPTVGGSLDLSSLTSIPETFNPTVGGSLYLRRGLGSVATNEPVYPLSWDNGKYILVDDILCELVSQRGSVRKCKAIVGESEFYILQEGNYFAHGKTLRQAKTDLLFKMSDRDPSDYEDLPLNHVFTVEEAVVCYRTITGACSYGVNNFLNNEVEQVKDSYAISEIIALTADAYGGKQFATFFQSNLVAQ